MSNRLIKLYSGFLIALLIVSSLPFASNRAYAAGNTYENTWKEYNYGTSNGVENKGYYLEPTADGKYPVLIFIHGSGGVSDIPLDTFRNLVEYWTTMGYMDEMVIIVPNIEVGTTPSIYEAFHRWSMGDKLSGLLGKNIKNGTLSSKIDTNAEINITGLSCGAAASLASGVCFKQYYTQIGAFSPFQGYYLGEGQWGWFNHSSELVYQDNADIFISYGDGEVKASDPKNFKTTSELYAQKIQENNNSSVSVSLYSFDSYYGGHGWKLFSAELFAYLYLHKNGTIPSDDLIKSAFNIPSPTNYTVSFNANGHGSAPAVQTITSGGKASKPSDPSASGYTFGGWYTDSACTTAYDFNSSVISNITLYAKWTAVSSGSGSGSGSGSSTTPAPSTPAPTPEPIETPKLTTGIAHVQDIGDVSYTTEAGVLTIGTRGKSKRLEEITINFENNTPYSGTLQYRVHVQNIGWMEWTDAGQKCGTEGQSLRIEAIEIRFTGELADYYSVEYCVHIQDYGDMQGWVKDGALAGTTGESKRIEELKIRIVPKNSGSSMSVKYRVHVQDYGWERSYASNGAMSGTSGESKRLEGIELFLSGTQYSGGIKYKTHVQDYGWQGWSYDGEMSGTQGEARRLEGICIELYGEIADYYDIYYRVHAQDIGWMAWARNGECAGTAGRSARLEGIQIVLVPKGSPAPSATYEGITAVTEQAFIEGF